MVGYYLCATFQQVIKAKIDEIAGLIDYKRSADISMAMTTKSTHYAKDPAEP
jgi:hypothetical protein